MLTLRIHDKCNTEAAIAQTEEDCLFSGLNRHIVPEGKQPEKEGRSVFHLQRMGYDSEEELVKAVLGNEKMWDQDLNKIDGLTEKVVENLHKIHEEGAEKAYASCL